jgi:hypothetical protein
MSAITTLLVNALKDHLDDIMRTSISTSDPTRADIVKVGRFQDDPLKNNIYIAISNGDPEKLEWVDGIVTVNSMDDIDFHLDPREIGGGQAWWRRGVVQVGCYFVREQYNEEQALEYAHTVMARASSNIENVDLNGLIDDFGEKAQIMFCYSRTFFESGGPPDSYIWRGKVHWQCLTERP